MKPKRQARTRHPAILGGLGLAAALVVAGLAVRRIAPTESSTYTGPEKHHGPAPAIEGSPAAFPAADSAVPSPTRDHALVLPWFEALRAAARSEGRESSLADALRKLTPEQIAELLALAHGAPDTEAASELRQRLIRSWAERDPQAAAARVDHARDGAVGRDLRGCIGATWAARDPAAAIEWAVGLASEDDRRAVSMAIAHELVCSTPVDTIRLVAGLPASMERDDLLCRAVSAWTSEDPAAAIAWLRDIPEDSLREPALAGALATWARQDPPAAAATALHDLRSTQARSDTLVAIAQTWAQRDAQAAAIWVAQLPSDELKQIVARNVLALWEHELGERSHR